MAGKKIKKLEDAPHKVESVDYSAYTFFMKTIQGSTIKNLTDVLKDIVHDVTLHFKPGIGITCSCVEGSKVCVVYMILHADRMEKFCCHSEERVSLSMDHLSLLTSMCGHNDQMTLYQLKTERNYISVVIETQDASMKSCFRLRLKAMDVYEINMDCTEYLSIITMPSAFFGTLCRKCSKLDDKLVIESLSDSLKIGVDGQWANGSIEIDQAKECHFVTKSDLQYKACFALRFLLLFTKATSLSSTVEMYLAQDYPLCLRFAISDLGELHLYQTALIEDDDAFIGD